jgi:hypothetical protein
VPPRPIPLRAFFVKWIYVAVAAVAPIAWLVGGHASALVIYLGIIATPITSLAWLCAVWSGIPASDRGYTRLGEISAFSLVVRAIIPVYNFYWFVVVHLLVRDAINDSLTRREMPTRAHAFAGIIASALEWIGVLAILIPNADPSFILGFLAVAHATWLAQMFHIDGARNIMILSYLAEGERLAREREKTSDAGLQPQVRRGVVSGMGAVPME